MIVVKVIFGDRTIRREYFFTTRVQLVACPRTATTIQGWWEYIPATVMSMHYVCIADLNDYQYVLYFE